MCEDTWYLSTKHSGILFFFLKNFQRQAENLLCKAYFVKQGCSVWPSFKNLPSEHKLCLLPFMWKIVEPGGRKLSEMSKELFPDLDYI